jgi:hypothetical protein
MDDLLKLLKDINARLDAVSKDTLEDLPADAACQVETEGPPSEWNEMMVEMLTAQAEYLRSLRK